MRRKNEGSEVHGTERRVGVQVQAEAERAEAERLCKKSRKTARKVECGVPRMLCLCLCLYL